MKMQSTRVLYFSAHQIQAYAWRGGECVTEGTFDSETPGPDFTDYLQANRRSLFAIVANVAEEGFHHEAIPFLQSRDRSVVVARRLAQLFQGSPYTLAVSLGYEKTRRKDEKLLLLGLTNASLFESATRAIRENEIRLSGIYSLPLLSTSLLEALKLPLTRTLLVTIQDNSIRQSYFDNGRLILSRVAPLTDSSTSGVTHAINAEVGRFHQYLLSQRTIGRSDGLDVHVLLHGAVSHAIATSLSATEQLRIHLVDLASAAKSVGIKSTLPDNRCQALFIHLACTKAPSQQFAPPTLRKEFRLWQVSKALMAAGVVAFAASLLFTGKTWIDVRELSDDTSKRLIEATLLDQRYQSLVRTFPPVPVAKETLRQLVARYHAIDKRTSMPQDLLSHVAGALDRNPDVEISRVQWANASDNSLTQRLNLSGDEYLDALIVDGTVGATTGGNARDLLASFQRFTEDVLDSKGRSLEVMILQQPFDVTSGSALRSGASELSSQGPRSFSVAVVRRLAA